jgi:hypothetical protein
MKLTPEQFEDILSGAAPQGDDICPEDLARLEEARAMRDRLAAAFDSTHAGESLADKVRASLQTTPAPAPEPRRRSIYFPTGLMSLAAAASVLIVITIMYSISDPEPALAGTVELANIHKVNLREPAGFYATGDCEEIKAYFQRELGFVPKLLEQCPKLQVVGCYVTKLHGKTVATYVVKLGDSQASVIVTEDWPKKLGLGCGCGHPHCKCIHNGSCEDLTIVSARLGERSYSIVGDLPAASLKAVLERLRG